MRAFPWMILRYIQLFYKMTVVMTFHFSIVQSVHQIPPQHPLQNQSRKMVTLLIIRPFRTSVGPFMIRSFRIFQRSLIRWNTPVLHIRFCTVSMRKFVGRSTYCWSLEHMQRINSSNWTLLFKCGNQRWSIGQMRWSKGIL